MVRENHVGAIGNFERGNVDSFFNNRIEFGDQTFRVDDDTGADDACFARVHNAARQQTQRERLAVDDDRVAGVVAALRTYDDIGASRQVVDDFTFSFVTPLSADDHCCSH